MNWSIRTRDYYESTVDAVYRAISGPILHLGMFEGGESREVAAKRTKELLAAKIGGLQRAAVIVDLGSGYGDAARFLAGKFGCQVIGVNLIHSQNVHALSLNREAALDGTIAIAGGDFGRVPLAAGCADVVWSQEAFLHAPDYEVVLQECARLLAPGGRLIFTDILQTDPLEAEEARLIYERVQIDSLESFEGYRQLIQAVGLHVEEIADLSRYVVPSYQDQIDGLQRQRASLVETIGAEFLDYTITAMSRWVRAGEEGKLGWGMFLARK